MSLTKIKLNNVIFDLDGTLVDSSFDVLRILIDSINKNGGNLCSNTKIKIGPPLIDMITSVVPEFSEEKKYKIQEDFRIAYSADDLKNTIPFDGIIELLNRLKENNIDVFIVTYKPKSLAMKILNRHFNNLYLDVLTPTEIEDFSKGKTKVDILNLLMSKWKILHEESVMVGDAQNDITCAKQLGISTIGALYGYGEVSEFEMADKKVNSVEELSKYLNNLIREIK